MMLGIVATTIGVVLEATPALGVDLSFTGTFGTNPNATQSFLFTADGISTVTIRSYSWGGGVTAAGTTIAAGGFDPILTLFNATTGGLILEREDISATPLNLDFQLIQQLPAGNYRAVISAFANYANGSNYADGFSGTGDFFGRTANYAVDILNVNNSSATAVPEPIEIVGTIVGGASIFILKRKLAARK